MAYLVRWEPFKLMRDLNRDLDRAFVNPFGSNFFGERGRPSIGDGYDFSPAVNTHETDKEYVVEAQVPGFTAETLQILQNDHGLTLRGERKQETEDKKANYHRREASYSSFVRTLELPELVNPEKSKAELKDGVLKVRFEKVEGKSQTKQISIKS